MEVLTMEELNSQLDKCRNIGHFDCANCPIEKECDDFFSEKMEENKNE